MITSFLTKPYLLAAFIPLIFISVQINCSKLDTDSGSTDDSESVSTFSSIYRSKLPTETNKADSIESDSKPSSNSAIPTTITTIEPYVGPFIFEDNTKIAGIDFDPKHPRQQRFPLGSGVVIFDYNNDDLDDIYIGDPIGSNALYRNDGGGKFTDVASSAGIVDAGRANGGCAADYDNDGDQDIYITNYGMSKLFRNEGNGTFTDVTSSSISDYNDIQYRKFSSTGCAWGDYDTDGLLDLIVVRHISYEEPVMSKGGQVLTLIGGVTLYHNDESGNLTNVTNLLGDTSAPSIDSYDPSVGNVWGAGFQPIWIDFDNDSDLDIYIANDFGADVQPNVLWSNEGSNKEGRWIFEDKSAGSGSNIPMYGMGLAVGDYDHDGYFDLYITNIGDSVLLRNNGDGISFTDTADEAGVGIGQLGVKQRITWGTMFFDYDNDTYEDLYVVSGYLEIQGFSEEHDYQKEQPNVLLKNSSDGTFDNVSLRSGADDPSVGRGGVFFDYDQDGCLDIFVGNLGQRPKLYRNTCNYSNNWLEISTQGTSSNRDGIGARISVTTNGVTQIREIASGRSNMGQNMRSAHFGMGSFKKADTITIRWPNGIVQNLENVSVNQRLKVVESK